jgi:hypothetical protein
MVNFRDPAKNYDLKAGFAIKVFKHTSKDQPRVSALEFKIRELMRKGLITVPGGSVLSLYKFKEVMYGSKHQSKGDFNYNQPNVQNIVPNTYLPSIQRQKEDYLLYKTKTEHLIKLFL